jgi:similar to stage IV sporulation protein
MFLIKIFHFFQGYVILSLKGFYIERFINICTRRGIYLWGMQKKDRNSATVYMTLNGFRRIRPVAKKTKTSVHIKKKCGLPSLLNRYRKRYFLYVGVLFFLLFMCVTSRFIWSVEIVGNQTVPESVVRQAVYDCGIREGVAKGKLPGGQQMKDMILNRVDGVSWAWVYVKGTRAVVEVKEKLLPPEIVDKTVPCDIVAKRDGLIKKVIVKEGKTDFVPGDAVVAGDVVIRGTLESETVGQRLVHAIGTVEASTWHEKSGEYKLYSEMRNPTKNKKTRYTLNLFSKKINLFFSSSIPYAEYDTIENRKEICLGKDNYTGIALESVTYQEVEVAREPLPRETVIDGARNELEAQIGEELLPGAVLIKNQIKDSQVDEETIKVTVTMEFIEKIGQEQKIGN